MRKRLFALFGGLITASVVLTGCGSLGGSEATPSPSTSTSTSVPSPSPTSSVSVTATDSPTYTVDVAKEATAQQGFKKETLKVNTEVDQTKAQAIEAGRYVFAKDTKVTTPALAAGFIATGSPEAKKVESLAVSQAKAHGVTVTHAMLVDSDNWVAIATGEKIDWMGNTYIVNGAVMGGAVKTDLSGSVVMVFVPPVEAYPVVNGVAQIKWVFFMRGACGNPQTKPPKPHTPPKPHNPPKVEVCDLHTKTIVVVSKKAAQSSRYTRDFSRCKTTPTPPPPPPCERTSEPTSPPPGVKSYEGSWWERLSDCSWHWVPRNPPCTKPAPPGPEQYYNYNPDTCKWSKKPQSFECQQNGGASCPPNDAIQPPQDNPRGVNTGTTPGAPAEPVTPAPGPSPQTSSPAPSPTKSGYDSGSSDGSGTPGGSLTDSSGTTTGSSAPSTAPVNTGQGGTSNTGDTGGF